MLWIPGVRRAAMAAAFLLTLAAAPPLGAQQAVIGTDPQEGYMRAGPGFACREPVTPGLSPEAWLASLPCLRFGPLALSMTPAEADALMARPFRTIDIGQGALARFYFFGQDRQRPYVAVVIRNDKITALQMTGALPDPRFVFSGIAPGMPQARLEERFGQPFSREPVASVGSELWQYGPHPFTFEVRDNQVFSVRISLDKGN